ncbi:hypothetical protein M5K25_016350 [Dendrobium thyrsiflorum]|uniref:Uncharacterized protein n=1 Tax=Dendrobium thyrsiflorum TaxID=117978 RepID=A0ABD0UJF8_DENTH
MVSKLHEGISWIYAERKFWDNFLKAKVTGCRIGRVSSSRRWLFASCVSARLLPVGFSRALLASPVPCWPSRALFPVRCCLLAFPCPVGLPCPVFWSVRWAAAYWPPVPCFLSITENDDDGIIRELLIDSYASSGKRKPNQIIIFEYKSKFNQVLNNELDKIIEACKFLDEQGDCSAALLNFSRNASEVYVQMKPMTAMCRIGALCKSKISSLSIWIREKYPPNRVRKSRMKHEAGRTKTKEEPLSHPDFVDLEGSSYARSPATGFDEKAARAKSEIQEDRSR